MSALLTVCRFFYQSLGPGKDLWWCAAVGFLCLLPLTLILGIAAVDIAMVGVVLMFLGHAIHKSDWAWLKIRWVPLALLIWVYYIAIAFQAIEVEVSLRAALPFGRFVLFGVACQYWLFSDRKVRGWMLRAIIVTCVFAVVNTWFQFFWGIDCFGVQARPGASWLHPVWPWATGGHYTRLKDLSGALKIGGMIITMAFPAVIHWLTQLNQSNRSSRYKWLSWVLAALTLIIIPLTAERTSTLWMGLGVVCCYLWVPQTRKGLWLMLLPAMLCWTVAFHAIPTLEQRMLGSIPKIVANAGSNLVVSEHKQNNIYTALNRTAINLYLAHPIWGVGLKQFNRACVAAPDAINVMRKPGYMSAKDYCNNSPQNMYLEFLANTGTVGTVLFLGLMALWAWEMFHVRSAFSRSQHSRYVPFKEYHVVTVNDPIMLGVLIAFFLRIFPFVTTTSFYFSWGAVAFWWFGGWLLAYADEMKVSDGEV